MPDEPSRTSDHTPDPPDGDTLSPDAVSLLRQLNLSLDSASTHDPPASFATITGVRAGTADAGSVGVEVPGYEILEELGRGGMGVVYKARQVGLNRIVAFKTMRIGSADPRQLIRFLAEAEVVAAVKHPSVVQIYEFGEHDGQPYMALEYLPGGTLAEALTGGRSDAAPSGSWRDAATLVAGIARGVAAAHAMGIVHRDLKPSNVLFDEAGNPKVTDFGLAKRDGGSNLTETWVVMGTPAYMAPEQASGRTRFAGPQADVWALGVILYECLTGVRPFQADTAEALLARIVIAEPSSVRSAAPAVPADLEQICWKCLAKNPEERYPTARELAEDLRRVVAGEPVSLRPPSLGRVLRLWAKQNFGSAGWTVAGGVAAGLLAGGYTALELVGTKLHRTAAAYEQLPSVPGPWISIGPIPETALVVAEMVMYLLLPGVLLATTLLVRPRNRSADVAAGLMTGLVGAVTLFTVAFGWWSVYSQSLVPADDDLVLLTGPDGPILESYPDLAEVPPEERRAVLLAKTRFDLAAGIPRGILMGMLLSVALTVPACVALVCWAGTLLRRDVPLRTIIPHYFEATLPALVFCGYMFFVAQRLLLYGTAPQYPGCYATLLTLTALAVLAARRRASTGVRVALQLAWIAYYAVTNAYVCYEF